MKKYFTLLFFVWGIDASALPSSSRLFQAKYGYRVSCNLCHSSGGGSAISKFGKDFLRSGGNGVAFQKIENLDSDGDGIPNIKEVLAKSNPGDAKSTPTQVGDWLANVSSIYIPRKELELLFPGYTEFSAIEGSLNAKQIEFYKSKLKIEPNDDDKVPTFYFAQKDGKRHAVAQLLSEKNADQSLNSGIAVSLSGQILNIQALGGSAKKSVDAQAAALTSYNSKSLANLPSVGATLELKLVHQSVLRNLYLVQAVFGGAAK